MPGLRTYKAPPPARRLSKPIERNRSVRRTTCRLQRGEPARTSLKPGAPALSRARHPITDEHIACQGTSEKATERPERAEPLTRSQPLSTPQASRPAALRQRAAHPGDSHPAPIRVSVLAPHARTQRPVSTPAPIPPSRTCAPRSVRNMRRALDAKEGNTLKNGCYFALDQEKCRRGHPPARKARAHATSCTSLPFTHARACTPRTHGSNV